MLDFHTKVEIQIGISRVQELLDSNILNRKDIFSQSALIEILINMKDLLIKSEKLINMRVSFKEEVLPDERLKITDIHDLISNFRDAACHNDSFRREFGSNIMAFNTIYGRGVFMNFGDLRIESKYNDDVAFNMGNHILYLERHLKRAFEQIKINFNNYL